GREHEPHAIAIAGLPSGWDVATAFEPRHGSEPHEFVAPDYDALVDTPVELGPFWRGRFDAAGVPHEFVVAGALPDFDGEQLVANTRRLCEAQIAFWHGTARPPFERYVFMLNALDDGHGGLEHRASTALVAARRDLPRRGGGGPGAAPDRGDGYIGVLGLVSHEYFHAWNVKRLRPRDFATFDYTRENYTELLWFFEGFTSYYDDLFVARSGIVDGPRYLKLLAKTVNAVDGAPGRRVQSLAEASFDAWVKYYRPDENTPNATISYYAKGALVALAFDLTLRSEGRGTLDDVMRRLWASSDGGPIDEGDIAGALEAVGGRSFAPELAAWVHGTDELPLPSLLPRFGVSVERQSATFAQRLGVRVSEGALTGVKVTHVLRDGAAEGAGLEAGDELIAVGGWRLRRLDDALRCLEGSAAVPLLVSRDQRVLSLSLEIAALRGEGAVQLRPAEGASAAERSLYEAWLAG
ncbi:MAG TPA: PDZ domain-containing protein, partial [Caldimonas sp.]